MGPEATWSSTVQSGKSSWRSKPDEEKGEKKAFKWGQLMKQKHLSWR